MAETEDIDLGSRIDGTQAARIVFLTAHAEPAFVERVSEITGYGYVLKGSGEFVLVQSIRMVCRLWRLHQDLTAQAERYRLITENMSESIRTVRWPVSLRSRVSPTAMVSDTPRQSQQ